MIEWKNCVELKDSLENYENEFNVNLPDDLKMLIKENNNAKPNPAAFKLQNGEEDCVKFLLSFNKNDKMNAYFCKRLEQIPQNVYPFAADPFGNFICLKDFQIVFFDSETEKCDFLSPSVSDFLESLH